jgi:hypothetical protein
LLTTAQFDPSRSQNHAAVDLADPGAPTVEPFYTPGVASTAASPEMAQYPRSAATTSDGGSAQDISRGPSSASSAGWAGRGAGGYGVTTPPPMPTIPDQYAAEAGAGAAAAGAGAVGAMSAKQREAYQEQQRFHAAQHGYTQGQVGGAGPSGAGGMHEPPMSPTQGSVTVHTDAGTAAPEDEEPNLGSEIPPT